MGRARVVLADDNEAMVESVRKLLTPHFDVVAVVSDGCAAYEAVVAHEPDVVILDMSMPLASGLEAAARMSAQAVSPRIVFLTVHEAPEYVAAARDAGACAYV